MKATTSSAIHSRRASNLRAAGVTLVELMVAITVGAFLTTGIISLFMATKQTYSTGEALSAVQEDGRYQTEHLAAELRQSGRLGCQRMLLLQGELPDTGTTDRLMHSTLRIKNALTLTDDDNNPDDEQEAVYWWLFNFSEQPPIEGFDGQGDDGFVSSRVPFGISIGDLFGELNIDAALDDQDVIVSRRVMGRGIPIVQHNAETDPILVMGEPDLEVGDIAIAATCEYATLFQVTGVHPSGSCSGLYDIEHAVLAPGHEDYRDPGNKHESLGMRFANDTSEPSSGCPATDDLDPRRAIGAVYKIGVNIYYLRVNPEGIRSLYRRKLTPNNLRNSEQMVTGVYGLQALYGTNSLAASCDTTGNAPSLGDYRPADQVANWNQVNSVKLSLILGSPGEDHRNVVEHPMTLPFPGAGDAGVFDAADLPAGDQRRLYQLFTSTIFLRNKLPCLGVDQWAGP